MTTQNHIAKVDLYFKDMIEIDLKKFGSTPYSEMNARGFVSPEGDGYIAVIIPIFEKDAIRALKNLELKRKLSNLPYNEEKPRK